MMCDRGLVENEHEVTILREIADLGSAKVGIILCCSVVRLHDILHLSYILLKVGIDNVDSDIEPINNS
uniref:Ovule protein n=1 Tax=Ascaris lumbricoides TaxID=6252 RepID=A0A0M3IGQ5_ASCLU